MRPWINLEYFYNKILELLSAIPRFLLWLLEILGLANIKILSWIISAVLTAGIIYTITRIINLQREKFRDIVDFIPEEESPESRSTQWLSIKKHIESDDHAQWRMAILEADNILDDIIRKIGVRGTNLGERLRNTEPSDFENLQNAWEAHKIRNRIAHEGLKFDLSKEEAGHAISLYEKCLKEFKFI